MIKLIVTTTGQVFGPFSNIRELVDRYEADGIEYPKEECTLVKRELPEDFSTDKYIDNGSELVKAEAPPVAEPVPEGVSMRQARLALFAVGKLKEVNDALAAMPGKAGEAARIEWEFSSAVYRNKPLVQNLGKMFGWSDADLDNLFIQANKL